MKQDAVSDLRKTADTAAGAWGKGMAEWERGRLTGHELGVLKRRMNKAQDDLRTACYVSEKGN